MSDIKERNSVNWFLICNSPAPSFNFEGLPAELKLKILGFYKPVAPCMKCLKARLPGNKLCDSCFSILLKAKDDEVLLKDDVDSDSGFHYSDFDSEYYELKKYPAYNPAKDPG
jgi:hypothetical protein